MQLCFGVCRASQETTNRQIQLANRVVTIYLDSFPPPLEWSDFVRDGPERLWRLCLWRYSKPNWIWLKQPNLPSELPLAFKLAALSIPSDLSDCMTLSCGCSSRTHVPQRTTSQLKIDLWVHWEMSFLSFAQSRSSDKFFTLEVESASIGLTAGRGGGITAWIPDHSETWKEIYKEIQ